MFELLLMSLLRMPIPSHPLPTCSGSDGHKCINLHVYLPIALLQNPVLWFAHI